MENQRPDWVQELFDEEDNFWKKEYPQKTEDDKVKFWSGSLYKGMRDQEESGLKIYGIYTKRWLVETLQKEPNFIEMLPRIYSTWGGMFDSGKVDRIIQKLLKELKE